MTLARIDASDTIHLDHTAILRSLNLNPNDAKTQALLLVCDRYQIDPLMKHAVLISGNIYITRDGYLHVAHRSGQFDGIEVLETGETPTHYTAKVAVYRRDMSHPFTYTGRFPKSERMAKTFGPEMAVKVAEVQALRRAFNVTGVAAADERWDVDPAEVVHAQPEDEQRALPPANPETGEVIEAQTTTRRRPPPSIVACPECNYTGPTKVDVASHLVEGHGYSVVDGKVHKPSPAVPSAAGDGDGVERGAATPAPSSPNGGAGGGVGAAAGAPLTDPQRRRLMALCGERGLAERQARLDWASDTLGRPLETFGELSKDEAATLMKALEAAPVAPTLLGVDG